MEEVRSNSDQYKQDQKERAIMKEMMPYFVYALIPIAITITIALVFGPKMTLP